MQSFRSLEKHYGFDYTSAINQYESSSVGEFFRGILANKFAGREAGSLPSGGDLALYSAAIKMACSECVIEPKEQFTPLMFQIALALGDELPMVFSRYSSVFGKLNLGQLDSVINLIKTKYNTDEAWRGLVAGSDFNEQAIDDFLNLKRKEGHDKAAYTKQVLNEHGVNIVYHEGEYVFVWENEIKKYSTLDQAIDGALATIPEAADWLSKRNIVDREKQNVLDNNATMKLLRNKGLRTGEFFQRVDQGIFYAYNIGSKWCATIMPTMGMKRDVTDRCVLYLLANGGFGINPIMKTERVSENFFSAGKLTIQPVSEEEIRKRKKSTRRQDVLSGDTSFNMPQSGAPKGTQMEVDQQDNNNNNNNNNNATPTAARGQSKAPRR